MNSPLRFVSSFKNLLPTFSVSSGRKRRNRSSVADGGYESLEKRNLLAVITVTTADDSIAADGLVSLREAVEAANTNEAFNDATAGSADGDVIVFAPEIGNQTLQLDLGELEISDDVRIIGSVGSTTIDAQGQSRIFSIVTPENVLLSRLDLTNGFAPSTGSQDLLEQSGGAISVNAANGLRGNLQISQSEIRSSTAAGSGGAIFAFNSDVRIGRTNFTGNLAADFISGAGGAISSVASDVSISRATFTNNLARGGDGGAIDVIAGGELLVSLSTFDNNSALLRSGGAISAVDAGLTISGSTFSENSSFASGGAVFSGDVNETNLRTIILNSEFTDNISEGSGGAFSLSAEITARVSDSLFDGNISGADDAIFTSGGGISNFGGQLLITGSVLTNNSAVGQGGAVSSEGGRVVVVDTQVEGNSAGNFGGGIGIDEANLTILASEIRSNQVFDPSVQQGANSTTDRVLGGGGVFVRGNQAPGSDVNLVIIRDTLFESNFAGLYGGGLANEGAILQIVGSTFDSNIVELVAEPSQSNFTAGGGGVYHRPLNRPEANLTVTESDFVQNSVFFGGLSADETSVSINETEFAGNSSTGSGGGLALTGAAALRLIDTDFLGNQAGSPLFSPFFGPDAPPVGLGGAIPAAEQFLPNPPVLQAIS